jgi:hypothetical protein
MAYTQMRVNCAILFTDEDNQTAGKYIDLVPGADAAAALANAADIVAAYAQCSSAAIQTYTVTFGFYDGALTPAADSEVQARANIVVDLVTDATHKQEYGVIEIPSPLDTLFLAASGEGKNIVDVADTNVVSLVDQYKAGGVAMLADRQVVETVDPIIRGKRFHRASKRG